MSVVDRPGNKRPSVARGLPSKRTGPAMRLQKMVDQTLIRGLVTASSVVRLGASQCLGLGVPHRGLTAGAVHQVCR
jgi:hypothetical protein